MKRKITIIGAGSVGSTIAYTLSSQDIASEIVLIDVNRDKLEGEVMDIVHGVSFRDPISIIAGDYEDAKDSDLVIITPGIARTAGQTRIALTQTNVDIIKDITPKIVKAAPEALYIIVSNPVDIITYVFTKISGLPEKQIIGSGTLLDTSRLRYILSEHFNVSQKNIHAFVFGEHGDSSFIPWSRALISGSNIYEYHDLMKHHFNGSVLDEEGTLDYIHKSGGEIIAKKGATFYAVSVAVCRLCAILFSAYDSVVTVSSMMHGEYGIEDVCLSVMTLVGPSGVKERLPLKLTDDELAKLHRSADVLKDVIKQIKL